MATALKDDVAQLAEACNMTCEQMHEKLKLMYGGYHFSERSPEVFNPFSLLSAFSNKDIREYWINNDSLSLIMSQLKCQVKDIMAMDNTWGLTSDFVHATMGLDTLLLLYQSGYLTIKSWEREDFGYIYTLSIPNQEVRTGLINHS